MKLVKTAFSRSGSEILALTSDRYYKPFYYNVFHTLIDYTITVTCT